MGVSGPSLLIESTDSMIYITGSVQLARPCIYRVAVIAIHEFSGLNCFVLYMVKSVLHS